MLKGGHDTLMGIVHWWMLEQNIKTETAKVKEALDRLVDEGFVVELLRKGFEGSLSNQPEYA
jgi:hypothetical protein